MSDTQQVSWVVQVPGKAKAASDDCPKIHLLRAKLQEKYGSTFFGRKPEFPANGSRTIRRGEDQT